MLQGKNILLGISGGIAAYKIPLLVRLLVKQQANVRVIITRDAERFVSKLTLSVLSKNKVYQSFETADNQWESHIELAQWADVFIIAPATANTLAKMASGICDNLLLATYLSAKCPIFFAPAMDLEMYQHSTTENNIAKLQSFGNYLIPSEYGELASGLVGEGRMKEPEGIVEIVEHFFSIEKIFLGKEILITAGPTYEAIDPVRFIGNFSSGKMGIALANAAQKMGAKVSLILGPTPKQYIHSEISVHNVVSAEQMYAKAMELFPLVNIAILSAAVSDYKPAVFQQEKIKKIENNFSIDLVKNRDILFSLGEIKKNQFLVGFALETHNEKENAKTKIRKKNLDAIVLNSLNDKGAGFATDTNKVTFITKKMEEFPIDLKPKTLVAIDILKLISQQIVNE